MTYCDAIKTMPPERRALHAAYHDRYYGFPLHDDNELFCRLVLEINQAGLSWELILKKEATFRRAYDGFDIAMVLTRSPTMRIMFRGPGGGSVELYVEIIPHATARPWRLVFAIVASRCVPPTLSKYTSIPSGKRVRSSAARSAHGR